jgi:hypothetical protein
VRAKPVVLKGINRIKKRQANGTIKIYLYHRATGLPLDPNNLVASYAAAEKTKKVASQDTLTHLIHVFDSSTYFDGLSETSRREYGLEAETHRASLGGCSVSTFDNADDALEFGKDALSWHDEMGKTSRRSADNLMACLARVLSFAKEKCLIKFNPIDTFKRLYKSDRSEKVWSDELQKDFIAKARPAMATAMYLVRNTGMRASDCRKFPWTRYNGTLVQIRCSKTGKMLWIPATRELKAHLDGLDKRGALVMLTPTGKAFTKRYFNECWREDADKVGAGDLNFHDNRGTAATLFAEAGATAPEIAEAMTWTTDRPQRIIDTYLARRGTLAANAIAKLEDYREQRNVK